jgi:ssDNA thymidine ADP-ribosyltransferase, DarT
VDRGLVQELHFITPFENVPSILERGILCKNRARKLNPTPSSIADEEVQARRTEVRLPPHGRSLHSYVNLYFDARNAMMSRLRHLNDKLAVLRVEPTVIDREGVIVSDRNAAAGTATFGPHRRASRP